MNRWAKYILTLTAVATLPSCAVGPDYKPPAMPMSTGYKGPTTQAAPVPQDWWRLFNDPALNALEEQAIGGNYDLQAAMARVDQARASAGIAKAGFFPTLALAPTLTRQYRGGSGGSTIVGAGESISTGSGGGHSYSSAITVPIDLNYEIDLWGRVRRQFEAAKAQTAASIADFGLVRLTLTTDLATQYFNLRSLDAQDEIASRNIETYKRQLDFLSKQSTAGFAAPLDVVQVRTLLESTQATQFDIRRQRAVAEHAIAILLGQAPANVAINTRPLTPSLPAIPAGLPADLLRRRPDVAEAEQTLVATNAQIGVAIADFLPTLSLGGAAGYRSTSVSHTFDSVNQYFTIGPSVSIPLFDASLEPNLKLSKAQYAEQLATYRTTLLGAFRDVEDALTNIDLQAKQAEAQDRAVADAREYVRLAEIQNRQGIITPLQVLDADRTLLTNELSSANILNARMASIVQLVRAIGGGWSADLPPAFTPTMQPTTQRLSD